MKSIWKRVEIIMLQIAMEYFNGFFFKKKFGNGWRRLSKDIPAKRIEFKS